MTLLNKSNLKNKNVKSQNLKPAKNWRDAMRAEATRERNKARRRKGWWRG